MKTCIIYSRVSTTKQGEDGISLEAQLQKGRDWALSNGRDVIGEFHDVASGSKDSRQGMEAAVKLACKEKLRWSAIPCPDFPEAPLKLLS